MWVHHFRSWCWEWWPSSAASCRSSCRRRWTTSCRWRCRTAKTSARTKNSSSSRAAATKSTPTRWTRWRRWAAAPSTGRARTGRQVAPPSAARRSARAWSSVRRCATETRSASPRRAPTPRWPPPSSSRPQTSASSRNSDTREGWKNAPSIKSRICPALVIADFLICLCAIYYFSADLIYLCHFLCTG